MTSTTVPTGAPSLTVPAPLLADERTAPPARLARPELAEWLQPRPLSTGAVREPIYLMPTGWHADRVVAAICQPGKPDGDVAAGPYHRPSR